MLKKVFVEEFVIGEELTVPLAIYEKKLNQYTNKSGQPAHVLILNMGDRTGKIGAVAWNNAQELFERVTVDQVWLVSGRVQEYRGQLQLVVEQIVPLPKSQIDLQDYLPDGGFDRQILWRRLESVMQGIRNDYLRQLLGDIFTPGRIQSFCTAPAGREVHHAYIGGLLEHTLEVVAYAETMIKEQGSWLSRDLLLTGCILHDIGKLEEYDQRSLSFQMTDRGKLLGHLQMGAELVSTTARRIKGFPEDLAMELSHMILAHHGVPEWGSPQEPKTANAMALHLADLTSSRLSQFGRIVTDHRAENGRWSNWDRFLSRSIFIPGGGRED